MCVYIYIYIYIHTHTHIHIYIILYFLEYFTILNILTFYIIQNFIHNMFYNFNYNAHVYTPVISPICEISAWHIPLLCVQWKTPDDGQWNCTKHVEFYSKNKFEKLVHLVRFIIRIYIYIYIYIFFLTQSKISVTLLCINFNSSFISDPHTTIFISQAI